jgi:hypothetical protein
MAADGSAASIGSAGDAERWPRVVGDEIRRVDCG